MKAIDGRMFKSMISSGYLDLKKHTQEVNDLNVFPVPDGDTGNNMVSTLGGGIDAIRDIDSVKIKDLASKVAQGMLLSARGNSGVILSQFFAGLCNGLSGLEEATVTQFAGAMQEGVRKAYSVVITPVEGTILTVMREGCEYAIGNLRSDMGFADYFELLIPKMRESLKNTPELLPVLKEAGVIDSGGAGLVYIVEGMAQAIGGRIIEDVSFDFESRAPSFKIDPSAFTADTPLDFGYCTEFILQLSNVKKGPERFVLDDCIAFLSSLGDSIVALQNGTLVKVHVHTKTPAKVLSYAQDYGEFVTIKIENMTLQHNETTIEKSRAIASKVAPKAKHLPIAAVAVAPTREIGDRLRGCGIEVVLDEDPTMSVSAEQFVRAFEKANADDIIVFPNNKNELMAVDQAISMYQNSRVHVVKSLSVAEGIASSSMLDFDNLSLDENLSRMESEIQKTTYLGIARTVRDSHMNGIEIKEGGYVGLLNEKVVCFASTLPECFSDLISKVDDFEDKGMLTAFFSSAVSQADRDRVLEIAVEKNDFLETYPFDGGSWHYDMIGLLQ